jgi:hypothetical protein
MKLRGETAAYYYLPIPFFYLFKVVISRLTKLPGCTRENNCVLV